MNVIYDSILGALREQDASEPSVVELSGPSGNIETLAGNTLYVFSEPITQLAIGSIENSSLESNVIFTAGDTITVSFPDNTGIVGDMAFYGGATFIICVKNGIAVSGVISYE